ncbi:MAG: TonB-dependent receptor [Acidobacteria bacterium]|nr:TonB-dependent receptor [Acidobacteriota bacterium]
MSLLAQVFGRVVDGRSGEPLGRVAVQLAGTPHRAETGPGGEFRIEGVAAGAYTLSVSTVGYHLVKKDFTLAAGESKEFEVVLTASTLRQTETVEVTAGPFEMERAESPSMLTLEGLEAKNLASVLADDPLRAVQGMPGVSSNNDFASQFSVRGADYHRIGLFVDDLLVHAPFHQVQGELGASMTILNGDAVDAIALHSGAWPARFADRTGGVLDVRSREGDRARVRGRATASASNAGALAEGPLGRAGRGSWIAGVRKSYLQYIIRRTSAEPSIAFGFTDGQGRLSYDLTPRHNLSLSLMDGKSGLDREDARARLGVNSPMSSDYRSTLIHLAWKYTPADRLLVTNRLAWLRERGISWSKDNLPLTRDGYGEWVWRSDATWSWGEAGTLELGGSARRLRDDGYTNRYQFNPFAIRRLDLYRGTGLHSGAYAQHAVPLLSGRVRLAAGARWDRHSVSGANVYSPFASLSLSPRASTRLSLGWGQYAQFPELGQFFSMFARPWLAPERANHFEAGLEQRLGARSRLRLEAYNRQDRDLLFRPWFEPRILSGRIFNPPADAALRNSQRGYARGVQMLAQRRSANGFTGWVSYSFGQSKMYDRDLKLWFPSDYDQRHTVNLFASQRIRPSVNLSVKWVYGSGFPVPGFLLKDSAGYLLGGARNSARLDPYHRLDFRANKSKVFDRWKLTGFFEVVNLFNRSNYRFDTFNGYNSRTGRATLTFDKMFPILPSAGIAVEF